MIKAIIFDADNTLYKVNKGRAYDDMFSVLAKEAGVKKETAARVWKETLEGIMNSAGANSLETRREKTIRLTLGKMGVPDKEIIEKASDAALKSFWNCILLDLGFDGSEKNTMAELKKKYVLCVASDEFRPALEAKLNKVFGKWRKYFTFLVSAEDAGEHKPSENYAKAALKKLKMKPGEVIVVGDSWQRDLELPNALGIKTVLVADKKEGKPDYFVKKLAGILELKLDAE